MLCKAFSQNKGSFLGVLRRMAMLLSAIGFIEVELRHVPIYKVVLEGGLDPMVEDSSTLGRLSNEVSWMMQCI
jgi:hypothetical protein